MNVFPNEQCFVCAISPRSACVLTATSLDVEVYTKKNIIYSYPAPETTLERHRDGVRITYPNKANCYNVI